MLDVLIIGGGPAGLQAALTLARGQRTALVVDAGPPRNARAHQLRNFVTRDGVTPAEFRAEARRELAPYGVEVRPARALRVDGERGAFSVTLDDGVVDARRILVCVGMVDQVPDLPGYRELWGHAVFQCPFCHGHEVRGQRFGLVLASAAMLDHALLFRGWTDDLVLFTDGAFAIDDDARERLAGITIEERRIAALVADGERLVAVRLADGEDLARDVLFARPPQSQTAFVEGLGLALDPQGFVVVDGMRQTSRPGIYAAGDLTSPMQAAMMAASAGMFAASALTHDLSVDPASRTGSPRAPGGTPG